MIALINAGCGSGPPSDSSGSTRSANTARAQAVRFSGCMRKNGVSAFPDPDAAGELTVDAVANGSSVDTDSAAFMKALSACRELKPPGFTGRRRAPDQQTRALEFAQCMRDHGVPDFPDPAPGDPLIDTRRIPSAGGRGAREIPGFQAATEKCHAVLNAALGRQP
jgi:hypothetical protein